MYKYLVLSLAIVSLASCSKKEETATTSTNQKVMVDTTQKAEQVAITDTSHHLFFKPQAGSTQRYHVVDKMTANANDAQPDGKSNKRSATSTTEYFLTQKVKSVNKDSTVELTYRVDSIMLSTDQDTSHIRYSSGNAKDRANDQYREFNLVVGKDFTVKTNKYGDMMDITDVASIANALIQTVPDTLRTKPQVKMAATQQAQQIVNAYVMRVLVHSPTRALIKDTTWKNSSDVNLDVAPGLSFPVRVDATETVKGLEKRGNTVYAVLEDNTTTTPKKTLFEEGPTKATVKDFIATSHSVVHIEDQTGLLGRRTMEEKRTFTFIIESKQQPGQKRTISQTGSEVLTTEMID